MRKLKKTPLFFAAAMLGMSSIASAAVLIANQTDFSSNPTPHSSSLLEVRSETAPFKGVLLSSMTTAEINSITTPQFGLLAFDETESCLRFNNCRGALIGSVLAPNLRNLGIPPRHQRVRPVFPKKYIIAVMWVLG